MKFSKFLVLALLGLLCGLAAPSARAQTAVTLAAANGNFDNPSGVAVDGSGNVFVADYANKTVKEILATGGYVTVNTLAVANGNFAEP